MNADLIHYFDYKSPYAYLAQDELLTLAQSRELSIEWRPYTLDIPSYLGSAEVDSRGQVIAEQRNAHQWRRVKYAYMDCRREANQLGVTLRGPRKIFDSRLAHVGFLYAQAHGDFRNYHTTVFEKFWRRELDIEDLDIITDTLAGCGIDSSEFSEFAQTKGFRQLESIQQNAETQGVFGVPSYLVSGELFWGTERFASAKDTALQKRSSQ